ncbi:hypothetical protein [Microbispora sp. KK1-11]|uniref:hypothetical protein n=1 Tax=Microbispora sp. KK1-11 TaxID=2053005 RepID=UPI00163BAE2D|nr:hypothetical protein [Microbispora sp. KK1-11]
MHHPFRLLSLAALTCVGLLAAAPAYAGCGCDTPKVAKPAAAAVDLGARADAGLSLGLGLAVDLDLRLGLDARAGTHPGTMSCGRPMVLRRCR